MGDDSGVSPGVEVSDPEAATEERRFFCSVGMPSLNLIMIITYRRRNRDQSGPLRFPAGRSAEFIHGVGFCLKVPRGSKWERKAGIVFPFLEILVCLINNV